MASIRKLPSGKWNVRVTRLGFPTQTKTFTNRFDAISRQSEGAAEAGGGSWSASSASQRI